MSSPTYTSVEIQAAQRAAKRAKAIAQIDDEVANIDATILSRQRRKVTLLNRRAALQERLNQNVDTIIDLKRTVVEVPDIG